MALPITTKPRTIIKKITVGTPIGSINLPGTTLAGLIDVGLDSDLSSRDVLSYIGGIWKNRNIDSDFSFIQNQINVAVSRLDSDDSDIYSLKIDTLNLTSRVNDLDSDNTSNITRLGLLETKFYKSRADLVTARNAGVFNSLPDGTNIFADGLWYKLKSSSTAISDLNGIEPVNAELEHFGDNTIPGTTDMRAALADFDNWVIAEKGRVLKISKNFSISSPISLKSEFIECTGRLIIPSTFTPNLVSRYVIRLGENSSTTNNGRLQAYIFVDGNAYFGKAFATWSPSSGVFPSGSVAGNSYKALDSGTIDGQSFVEGDLLRATISNASTTTYLNNWIKVPVGVVSTDWSPAAGTFPSGAADGAAYKATTDGAIDGIPFSIGDYIYALKANPSTTTWSGNWSRIFPRIAAVRIDGAALPHVRVSVDGKDCETVLHVRGNSERSKYAVGAQFCHLVYFDQSFEDGEGGASSPDNNSTEINTASCGQYYFSHGTSVTGIKFDAQNQLTNYLMPPVDILATRKPALAGVIRTPRYGCIRVFQRTAPAASGVHFEGLVITNPITYDRDWLIVESKNTGVTTTEKGTNALTGSVVCKVPRGGVNIERAEGCDLTITVDGQLVGSYGLKLGSTSKVTSVIRSRINFLSVSADAAVTGLINAERFIDSVCDVVGVAKPSIFGDCSRSMFRLPVSFITQNVSITKSTTGVIQFIGSTPFSEFLAYSYAARGMSGITSDGLQVPVYATLRGTNQSWQTIPTIDIDNGGSAMSLVVLTASGDGVNKIFTGTHNIRTTPTAVVTQAASVDATGTRRVSTLTTTQFTVEYDVAPIAGTNNVILQCVIFS